MFVPNQPSLAMEVAKYDRYLNTSRRLAMSLIEIITWNVTLHLTNKQNLNI